MAPMLNVCVGVGVRRLKRRRVEVRWSDMRGCDEFSGLAFVGVGVWCLTRMRVGREVVLNACVRGF